MSVERSFEACQNLAERLKQRCTCLIDLYTNHPLILWLNSEKQDIFHIKLPNLIPGKEDVRFSNATGNSVSRIFNLGNKLGKASAEFAARLNEVVQPFYRRLPFRQEKNNSDFLNIKNDAIFDRNNDFRLERGYFEEFGISETATTSDELMEDEDDIDFNLKISEIFGLQGSFDVTSTYDSRTHEVESSVLASGDSWRAEVSHGGSTLRRENSPIFIQLGPLLYVPESTLLLPIHMSQHHFLWYGFDRKNGMHSLCPAIWSKHRQWLLMSMIHLNPLACSYLDLHFPNGQLKHVSGEGITVRAFLPVLGGLLQGQGNYPGQTSFSFSCKNTVGTRVTPAIKLPDRSFSLEIVQQLAWKQSNLMMRPTLQVSLCPMFGGSNPGIEAEVIHYMNDDLNLTCGCSCTSQPSAYVSVSLGRSKWNRFLGRSGVMVRVETPISTSGTWPAFTLQLSTDIEF